MSFIVIVIVLLLYYFWDGIPFLQDRVFYTWYDFTCGLGAKFSFFESYIIWFVVGIPLLCLYCLLKVVEWQFFGVFYFVTLLLTFAWSLGRLDLKEKYKMYCQDWSNGHGALALHELFGDAVQDTEDDKGIHITARKYMIYYGFQTLFCSLFWFAFLGIYLPVIHRALCLIQSRLGASETSRKESVSRLIMLIEWLPIRIFVVLMNCVPEKKMKGFSDFKEALIRNVDFSENLGSLVVSALNMKSEPTIRALDFTQKNIETDFYNDVELECIRLKNMFIRVVICYVVMLAAIHAIV